MKPTNDELIETPVVAAAIAYVVAMGPCDELDPNDGKARDADGYCDPATCHYCAMCIELDRITQ